MGGNRNKFKASRNSNDIFSESNYNSDVTTAPIINEFFNGPSSNSSTLPSEIPFNNDFVSGSAGSSRSRNDQQRNRSKKQNKYDAM